MATINDHDAIIALGGFKHCLETARNAAQDAINRFGGDAEAVGAGRVRDICDTGIEHLNRIADAFNVRVEATPFQTQAQAAPVGGNRNAEVADLLQRAARLLQG